MYYLFVNPASKSGSGTSVWEEAKKILDQKNVEYQVFFTKKDKSILEDYSKIHDSASEWPIKLIILGGDGTLNQCIEGITDPDNTEISLIRNGSGNDFTRDKVLPVDMENIIDGILLRKNERHVDIGYVQYSNGVTPDNTPIPDGQHRFLVSSGYGYDADICYNANKSTMKKVLGKLIYLFYGLKNIFTTALANFTVTIDNHDEVKTFRQVYFIACMNQPVEGGGVPMVPYAIDSDGKLGFCIFHSMSRFKALLTIPSIYKKKHVTKKGVEIFEGRKITIESDSPKMVHYDGETPGMYKRFSAQIAGNIKFIY